MPGRKAKAPMAIATQATMIPATAQDNPPRFFEDGGVKVSPEKVEGEDDPSAGALLMLACMARQSVPGAPGVRATACPLAIAFMAVMASACSMPVIWL